MQNHTLDRLQTLERIDLGFSCICVSGGFFILTTIVTVYIGLHIYILMFLILEALGLGIGVFLCIPPDARLRLFFVAFLFIIASTVTTIFTKSVPLITILWLLTYLLSCYATVITNFSSTVPSLQTTRYKNSFESHDIHECIICLDRFKILERVVSCEQCTARYHLDCIDSWNQRNSSTTCVACRYNLINNV
jgi:hypothetical protein